MTPDFPPLLPPTTRVTYNGGLDNDRLSDVERHRISRSFSCRCEGISRCANNARRDSRWCARAQLRKQHFPRVHFITFLRRRFSAQYARQPYVSRVYCIARANETTLLGSRRRCIVDCVLRSVSLEFRFLLGNSTRVERRERIEIVRGIIFHESQLPRYFRRDSFTCARTRDARLSRCYSSLNPFQGIIRDGDNEPNVFARICKQISGGNELEVGETREATRHECVEYNRTPKPFNWMKRAARGTGGGTRTGRFGVSCHRPQLRP